IIVKRFLAIESLDLAGEQTGNGIFKKNCFLIMQSGFLWILREEQIAAASASFVACLHNQSHSSFRDLL
ncbi:MAG TPA: hypothetical protein H9935_14805, partial [Candidatus Blautia merdigallinarum]|nr:hypothetical protein [Candidatus Blautia merdigallinarum]